MNVSNHVYVCYVTSKTIDRVTRISQQIGGELSSCSNSDTRRVALATNPVISHE
jgi:hypothetical protein